MQRAPALAPEFPGDEKLFVADGQAAIPVYPSAKDAFYYKVVDGQVTFVRDANGKITQLILHQNGRDIPAVRSWRLGV